MRQLSCAHNLPPVLRPTMVCRAAYTNATGHLYPYIWFRFYMANMPATFADGMFKTMDAMVEWVLKSANQVNRVQLIVLVVEGCVCSTLAATYVWLLTLAVARQRFTIYSVFLAIPQALVRGLATLRMDLDEEEDDDDGPADGAGEKWLTLGLSYVSCDGLCMPWCRLDAVAQPSSMLACLAQQQLGCSSPA